MTDSVKQIVGLINNAALDGSLTADDVRIINAAMKRAFDIVVGDAKCALKIGQTVSFKNRDDEVVIGTVKRLLKKNVEVQVPGATPNTGTLWRVTATMLTVI